MLILRSALFNVAFYATLVVLMIAGLPALLFGRSGVYFMARLWARVTFWQMSVLCGLRVEYRGLENIPDGGCIVASKHQSFLETFSLVLVLADVVIVLKRALTYIPVFGFYMMASRQIAIDRSRGKAALDQIVQKAKPALGAGEQLLIFPEGTRRAPGAPPDYRFGVAAIYAGTGAPCLPVALNTGLFWGRRGFLRYPGVAVIEFLPAIPPGLDAKTFLARLQNNVEAACGRLNEEAFARDPSLRARIAASAPQVAQA